MAAPPPSEPLGASTLGKADLSKTYKCFMLHECRMWWQHVVRNCLGRTSTH